MKLLRIERKPGNSRKKAETVLITIAYQPFIDDPGMDAKLLELFRAAVTTINMVKRSGKSRSVCHRYGSKRK